MNNDKLIHIEGEGFVIDHGKVDQPLTQNYPSHIHDSWEILFFLRGDVIYKVEGKIYTLKKGDLVLTRPSVFHQIQPTETSTYERYNIIFDYRILQKEIKQRLPEVDVISFRDNQRIFDLFEKFELYGRRFDGELLTRIAGHLVEEILYNLAMTDEVSSSETVSNPLVNKALAYIDEHLTEIGSIDQICKNLYITKSHLHHLFSKNLGVTPKQYITSKRLLLAQKMIRHGKKATEVATLVGFDDYATFFRNYKKHFGYSPSEQPQNEPTKLILA